MLEAVLTDNGQTSITALARAIGMPISTAHRQVATLGAQGFLARQHGRHVAGPRLLALLHRLDEKQIITNAAAPLLDRLAETLSTVVQLGTFENDMVTYRIKTGAGADGLFTRAGMQLEAYCSAIGKVMLAHMLQPEKDAYLASGPFVALTAQTIVDPEELREELAAICEQGFAVDDEEVADGLVCIAVPIRTGRGRVVAALSASFMDAGPDARANALPILRETARRIEFMAFGSEHAN